jgi:hypothetical protein
MRSRKAHAEMVTVGCWKYFDWSLNLNGFTDTIGSRRECPLTPAGV